MGALNRPSLRKACEPGSGDGGPTARAKHLHPCSQGLNQEEVGVGSPGIRAPCCLTELKQGPTAEVVSEAEMASKLEAACKEGGDLCTKVGSQRVLCATSMALRGPQGASPDMAKGSLEAGRAGPDPDVS